MSTRIEVNTLGTVATVRVAGPAEGFEADVQLPSRVGVVVELEGGGLMLSGVEGGKDVSAKSGSIELAVGRRESYRRMTVSVQRGEVFASAFGESARGSGRLEWTGRGLYDLRVRVGTGRVRLTE